MRRAVFASGVLGLGVAFVIWLWQRRARQHSAIKDHEAALPPKAANDKAPSAQSEGKDDVMDNFRFVTNPAEGCVAWAAQAAKAAKDALAAKPTKEANASLAQEGDGTDCPENVEKQYVVDNTHLQASTPGLGYRRTRSHMDRADGNALAPWGTIVRGIDERNGWLRVGSQFLPMSLEGVAVLQPQEARGCSSRPAPQKPDYLVSWTACPDQPDATSCIGRGKPLAGADGVYVGPSSSRSKAVRSAARKLKQQSPQAAASSPCPQSGWQYLDMAGNVQGPFTLAEMQLWNSKGYFRADLLMRCNPKDSFVALAALFPAPLIPFQSHPKRPRQPATRHPR
mmetsp:Transcript_36039/g.67108  ORF Transcript_36039/g.67108 Transcript_36039/m.67108 type:complete len:339 (-) Transcript_36039:45-1061(-)